MLSPETLTLLHEWWKVRTTHYDQGVPVQERWLFPGRRLGLHLTERQVNRLFHETADAAGIRKAVNLHTLRHSFATHLFDRGVDIRTIQALLGHSKLETTARYTRVATGLISSVVSPLDLLSAPRKRSRKSIGKLGEALETAFVGAYLGAVKALKSNDLKAIAAQIGNNESRHLAILSNIAAGTIVSGPSFPKALTAAQATRAVTPFLA